MKTRENALQELADESDLAQIYSMIALLLEYLSKRPKRLLGKYKVLRSRHSLANTIACKILQAIIEGQSPKEALAANQNWFRGSEAITITYNVLEAIVQA